MNGVYVLLCSQFEKGFPHCDSGQSHQETEGIAGDHTLDHLMDQEAAAEAGVTAIVQGTLGDFNHRLGECGGVEDALVFIFVFNEVCVFSCSDRQCIVNLVVRICRGFRSAF